MMILGGEEEAAGAAGAFQTEPILIRAESCPSPVRLLVDLRCGPVNLGGMLFRGEGSRPAGGAERLSGGFGGYGGE